MLIMEPWLWGVSGFLWLISLALIGTAIQKLLGGRRLLRFAELDVFVSTLKMVIHDLSIMKTEAPLSTQVLTSVEKLLAKAEQGLQHIYELGGEKAVLDTSIAKIKELRAASQLALAAAFFAAASVALGISAVLIAIFAI